jgi:hypothetical protein
MMAEVAHTYSVEGNITAAIKNAVDLDGFSLLVFHFTTKR